jgi:uracil-DNA glycosylase family 4
MAPFNTRPFVRRDTNRVARSSTAWAWFAWLCTNTVAKPYGLDDATRCTYHFLVVHPRRNRYGFALAYGAQNATMAAMTKEVDLNRVVGQHLEMEGFFTGFLVRGQTPACEAGAESHPPPAACGAPPSVAEGVRKPPRARTRSGAAGKELEAVAAEAGQCRKCALGSTRTHPVPGEGSPQALIMFIGEAPGADEDAQGRPFVGRAGQLLDKIIEACGLKRRPPDNRDPRPEEIVSCLPYLQRQIEAIEPEVIVALGAHAARTLLNTNKGIGELRGQFHEYYPGLGRPPIKLMATYHTAFLLRSYTPENRRRVWDDMKKVLAEIGLPVPERGKG